MRLTLTAAALALVALPAFADPVHGTWKTSPDDNGNFGHIEITDCGGTICGTLVRAYDGSGKQIASENVGKQIIWNMSARSGGEYRGGKIWSPDRNKTYNSRMELAGDNLAVSGCVLGICRDGGTWTRVK